MAVVIGTDPSRRAFLKTGAVALGAMLMPRESSAGGVTEQLVAAAGPSVSTAVGQAIYAQKCVSCHKAAGTGMSGVFPALAGNAHVNAADATSILGTIEQGRNAMPSWKGQLSSADIAAA
jgi:mono/diheme cytochrome c family protein